MIKDSKFIFVVEEKNLEKYSSKKEEEKRKQKNFELGKEEILKSLEKSYGFKIVKEIGKGKFGDVRTIRFDKDGGIYAIKVLYYEGNLGFNIKKKAFSDEGNLSLGLKHKNIIKTYSKLEKTGEKNGEKFCLFGFVMEKASFGSLNLFIHHYNKGSIFQSILYCDKISWLYQINENIIRFFFKQILQGIKFLNENKLAHFDIKPENILLGKGYVPKICDFSLTDFIQPENNQDFQYLCGGTTKYMGPEYYTKERKVRCDQIKKVDYFALGSILFLLTFKRSLIHYDKIKEGEREENYMLIKNNLEDARKEIKNADLSIISKDYKQFLNSLIQDNPEDRPSIEKIIDDRWLNDNTKEINEIFNLFQNDGLKIFTELQKFGMLSKRKTEQKKDETEKKHYLNRKFFVKRNRISKKR